MRRQVSMGHRKRCRKRNSQAHQRHPGSAGQGVDQRDQDKEAGVVDHRQSDQEPRRQHGELHPAGAKQVCEGVADGMGGATLLDEFAKNGAEDQDQNEAAHCVADAFQNRPQRSFGAHPVEHAHKKRCQQERQKRVQFQPDDQQKEEDDREREQNQGHRREQGCCAASNRRYSAGDKAREIAPHVIPCRFRREQAGPCAHTGIGVSGAVDQASKHRPETAEVPGHPAVRSVAPAKEMPAERLTRQLVCNQISLNMGVAFGAKNIPDIGAFESQVPGQAVKLFGLEVAGAAAAHVDRDQRPFRVALGHAAQPRRRECKEYRLRNGRPVSPPTRQSDPPRRAKAVHQSGSRSAPGSI